MEKAEINVVRFSDENVIATSAAWDKKLTIANSWNNTLNDLKVTLNNKTYAMDTTSPDFSNVISDYYSELEKLVGGYEIEGDEILFYAADGDKMGMASLSSNDTAYLPGLINADSSSDNDDATNGYNTNMQKVHVDYNGTYEWINLEELGLGTGYGFYLNRSSN